MDDKVVYVEEKVTGRVSGMHPGVVNGRRVHPKTNTSKPYKSGKGKLGKHQKRLGQRRSAHSATIARASNATAYKTPGSMKQRNG